MALAELMKLYSNKSDRCTASLWEHEAKTGLWLGNFSTKRIPKVYADREVIKYNIWNSDCKKSNFYPRMLVVIK